MDQVKFQQISRVGGDRPTGPAQAKDPATGQKWEQALRQADQQLERVSQQVGQGAEPARSTDPAALQDEVRRTNEQFQQMMKLHHNLSQLYHQIHKLDSDKA